MNNKRSFDGGPSIEADVRALLGAHDADAAVITPLECPLVWARESNAFDCVRLFSPPVRAPRVLKVILHAAQSTVFNFEPETDPELCEGTYFTNAIPVVRPVSLSLACSL